MLKYARKEFLIRTYLRIGTDSVSQLSVSESVSQSGSEFSDKRASFGGKKSPCEYNYE